MLAGKSVNEHHMVPKTFKGKETTTLHVICHSKIHSVFAERELLQYYHTAERIREHPEMQKFISWVQKKDPEFRSKNKATQDRQRKRRR